MLGGHIPELVIVLVLALVVFGPKRLPEIGESLGKGLRGFRQSVRDLEEGSGVHEIRGELNELKDSVRVTDDGGKKAPETGDKPAESS